MRIMRQGLLCVATCCACSAFLAGTAVAGPPTLTGVGIAYHPYWGDAFTHEAFTCQDNPDGGGTFRVSLGQTSDTGPYAGDRHTTIDLALGVLGSGSGGVGRKVLALSGDFTIDSPEGQVRATLSLDRAPGSAGDCYEGGPVLLDPTDFRYTATITTSAGVFVDRGRGTVEWFKSMGPRNAIYDYQQRFTSDLTAPEQNEAALFGQRVPGGSFSAMSANTKRVSPFTLFAPATVRKLYAYVDGKGTTSGSQTIRAVLYRNSGGPAAYVTRSFDFTVPAGMSARWVPLYLAPPAPLSPGVYWLGIQSGTTNGVARFAWNSKPNARRFNVDAFADGSSDPFGSALADDQQLSIFAAGSY